MGGSMGRVVGEKFARACESAAERGVTLVSVTASGGARMQEGILSLMQMPKTVTAVEELHEPRCALVSVMAHPTTAGVLASFASLGDVLVAEPGALLSFTGPRVVQQTTREKLPDDFGLAESNLRFGHVDAIVPRPELRAHLARLLRLLNPMAGEDERRLRERLARLSSLPLLARARVSGELARLQKQLDRVTAEPSDEEIWRTVELARHEDRPYTLDYVERILEDFVELHGDRIRADDPAIVAGLGKLDGRTVVADRPPEGPRREGARRRNFGMAYPEGYRKAMRVMELADRLGFPVVTLVDTPGAYPGLAAEQHGQGGAIAQLAGRDGAAERARGRVRDRRGRLGRRRRARARRPGADAGERDLLDDLAGGLRGDPLARPAEKEKAAAAFKPDAVHCLELGVIDSIVAEPEGGAQVDHDGAARLLREALVESLDELDGVPGRRARRRRRARFRSIGVFA